MSMPQRNDFIVRPEVVSLFETSFILCGLLYCEHCNAFADDQTSATPCSDRHYYLVAENAYGEGWRVHEGIEYGVLCGECTPFINAKPQKASE